MSILVWNCQGLGNPDTRKRLRELVFKHNVSVVYLMETKQKKSFLEKIRNNLGFGNHHYFKKEGKGGGLALWWHNGIQTDILESTENYIDVQFNWIPGVPWWCTFLYGSPTQENRHQVMNSVAAIRRAEEKAWVVLGDFNAIKSPTEKVGGRRVDENACKAFEDWIDECGFDELTLSGGRYTWSNNRTDSECILEKLDRVFYNSEWSNLFPYANGLAEPAIHSDHATIIMALMDQKKRGPKKFRFEAKWLEEEQLQQVIENSWGQSTEQNIGEKLPAQLKATTTSLRNWAKRRFLNPKKEINRLNDRIAEIRQCVLTQPLKEELIKCIDRMEQLKRIDEKHWFSRARIQWLNYGDKNSKFFHATTVQRRRFNTIRRLKNKLGQWIEDPNELNKWITEYYNDQFQSTICTREDEVLSMVKNKVTDSMNNELLSLVSDREIRDAVFNLGAHKAPGPDGYSGVFYHKFWKLIKESVMEMVRTFFQTGKMPDNTNKVNLVLIPKVDNPESVEEFRPIGCCNFSYKIIARIVTSRMKNVMSDLISPMQAAFVPGRQIQDNLIIAHEVFNALKGRNWGDKGMMAIKLDLAKAYDKVSWSFLRKLMLATGFDENWTNKVMECVTTASLTITVNGEETGTVKPGRGLRQGDPLSPCLFNLIANIISVIIDARVETGGIKGYRINRRCPLLSHLLFADDCLIFGEANVINSEAIVDALELFQATTGQRVNYLKSSVFFSPNTGDSISKAIINTLKVKKMDSTTTYLGLPTIWGRGKKAALGFLKEKINKRIYSWRGKFLSQAGKEVLIKSVVSAMPVYVMQVFKIPKTFCVELNVLLNRFWWGRQDDASKGVHWLAWDKLSKQKVVGGVGFRDFQAFNISLLAKQAGRLINEPDTVWAKLLRALYFPYTDATKARKIKKASWAWTSIYEGLQFLQKDLRWNVGNGKSIAIWDEKWVPMKKDHKVNGLRPGSSNLFYVEQLIEPTTKVWKEGLIRNVFDEQDSEAILAIPISSCGAKDRLVWHRNKIGKYSAKEGYHAWMDDYSEKREAGPSFNIHSKDMNWGSVWGLKVLPKIRDLIWRACHGIIPTNGNLARRKHSRRTCCDRCGDTFETAEHALFLCPTSTAIWRATDFSYTPSITGFNSVAKWWMAAVEMSKIQNNPLNLDLIAFVIWEIWKCRNRMVFEHTKEDPIRIWKLAETNYNEFAQAKQYEKERLGCHDTEEDMTGTSAHTTNGNWIAPPRGTITVNCDAAFDTVRGIAGIAVVARDWEGTILDGANERLATTSAFAAECLALRLGSRMINTNKWNNVQLRSDCKSAVETIHGRKQIIWEVEASIQDTIFYINSSSNVSTIFVKRSENQLADWVAKNTLHGCCPHNWVQEQPENLVMKIT